MQHKTFIEIEENTTDWWLNAKSEIVCSVINKFFKSKKNISILDLASGTGHLAKYLYNNGYKNITVSDRSKTALKILKKKFSAVVQINLPDQTPKSNKYDCILALDAVEHIQDDKATLNNIRVLLKKNGRAIITVPAFMFLWSVKDDVLEHKRRYTLPQLKSLLLDSGYSIEFISYYNFFLFLPAFVYSLANKKAANVSRYSEKENVLFRKLFSFEKKFLTRSLKFPFGVSIIAVVTHASKK